VESIYLKLRARNLCNHRDYQNLARNGANSNDTISYAASISRNPVPEHKKIELNINYNRVARFF
jgi:acyloxyacyl hydrolase